MSVPIETSTSVIWPWHNWFAWYPVWTPDCGWAWLKQVKRRWIYKPYLPFGPDGWWEHHTK